MSGSGGVRGWHARGSTLVTVLLAVAVGMAVGVPRFELSGNAANADTVWYTHDTLTLTGASDQAAPPGAPWPR